MVYVCQLRTYEAGRGAAERQTCDSVANSVANHRFRLVQFKVSSMDFGVNPAETPTSPVKVALRFLHVGVGVVDKVVAAVGGVGILLAL